MVAPPSGSAERRIVSVLFADLVGSTRVAESMDPEDWADLATEALAEMSAAVERYEGTVARLMGDGLLALFGAPRAREDDALRALRAGWEMVDVGPRLRQRALALGAKLTETALLVRVGIDTGDVVATTVGTSTASEYTVLGDAANVAARLEKAAQPGSVLASGVTFEATRGAAIGASPEAMSVDGRVDPVSVRRLAGFGDGVEPMRRSLVGRDAELERLQTVLDGLQRGKGAVVGVFAEAGLGKSSLLAVLLDRATSGTGTHVVSARPDSYGSRLVYGLAARIVHRLVESTDTARLREVTDVLGGQEGAVDPTIVAAAIEEAVRELVHAGNAVLFVLDDLHWADHASMEVIRSLLGLMERLPVGLVWAARPFRQAPVWSLKQLAETDFPHLYEELRLSALGRDDAITLVRQLFEHPPEGPLLELAVERAEGNPFFLEELAQELRNGTGGSVPHSLRLLVQSRTDRLTPAARRVLDAAAVAGLEFDPVLLERVVGVGIDAELHELAREGLVVQEGADRYRFRHSLTHEAAYDSILGRRRRLLHGAVGAALEEGGTADHAHLAEHFTRAGDDGRAVDHWLAAGGDAMRVGAFADAGRYFSRGFESSEDSDPRRGRLLVGRGRARDVTGDLDGAREDLESALQLASIRGDDELAWMAATALGEVWAAHDYSRAGASFRQALTIARRRDDDRALAVTLNRLGNWYANAEDPGEGIVRHTEALDIFQRLGDDHGTASTRDLLGMANLLAGDISHAHENFEAALRGFRRLDDERGQVGPLIGSAIGSPLYETLSEVPTVRPEVAEDRLSEALVLAESLGWASGAVFARFMRCQLRGVTGRLGEALEDGWEALEVSRRIGHDQWIIASLQSLAPVVCDALAMEEARALVSEARRLCDRVGSRNWTLHVAAVSAVVEIRSGAPEAALGLLAEPLRDPRGRAFGAHRLCLVVQAWATARVGDHEQALRMLAPWEGADAAPLVRLVRGLALLATAPDEAMVMFESGAASAHRWGMVSLEWQLLLEAARAGSADAGARGWRLLQESARSLDETWKQRMDHRGAELFSGTRGGTDGMV